MKKCVKCKVDKPLKEYNKNSTRCDGYQSICRPCSNLNSKKHYYANPKKHRKLVKARHNKIIEWLNQKKSTLSCEMCGQNHPATLQFHHINPKKKELSISAAVGINGWSIKRIEKEISKCKILCANCHFILHWKR